MWRQRSAQAAKLRDRARPTPPCRRRVAKLATPRRRRGNARPSDILKLLVLLVTANPYPDTEVVVIGRAAVGARARCAWVRGVALTFEKQRGASRGVRAASHPLAPLPPYHHRKLARVIRRARTS